MEPLEKAQELYDRGLDDYRAGEYDTALEALQEAHQLYAEAGDKEGESETLNDLGVVCIQMERWDQAQQALEEALSLRQEIGHRSGQGITLGNLGMMYERRGDKDKAIETYEQAAAIFEELGEKGNEKAITRQLAKLKVRGGRFLGAMTDYERGIDEGQTTVKDKAFRRLVGVLDRVLGIGPASLGEDEEEEDVIDVPATDLDEASSPPQEGDG